ncbi:MAG: hypothetical protein J5865_06045 [Lachnospiraceae bacterium]|nr:hypothetical protein [Lachnospiraceae bacterium]
MRKFAVFSGFLGAGKTTAMIAVIRRYSELFGKAAMISNDLGRGVTLADHRQALLSRCAASEITEECICFVHERLAERLNAYYDNGFELVLSDIPGFGVGALEHVYHGMNADYPGLYDPAPFTVLIEPRSVAVLRGEIEDGMAPILDAQLKEADLIVLNKRDLLSDEGLAKQTAWLQARYPEAKVLAVSALTGAGIDELCLALKDGTASLRHPEIDYEDAGLIRAMDSLTEYYLQYHAVVCCNDFDGTAYLFGLAEAIRQGIAAAGGASPHFKLLAWSPEGDWGKADLLGTDRPIQVTRAFARPCTQIAVLLNTSARCPAKELEALVESAVFTVSDRYQLELTIHKKDCFNLGE